MSSEEPTMDLYRMEAAYEGEDPTLSPYTQRTFWAEDEDAAVEFTKFILNDWKDSWISVSAVNLCQVPSGYRQGDGLPQHGISILVDEWWT